MSSAKKAKAKASAELPLISGSSVDLSLQRLTVVPIAELLNLQMVTDVDLSSNQLTVLPAEFARLDCLTRLDLSKNKLVALPANFGNLEALRHLDLLGNALRSLPFSFGQLKNLKWLDVKNNDLSDFFPDDVIKSTACNSEAECRVCSTAVVRYMQGEQKAEHARQEKSRKKAAYDESVRVRLAAEASVLEKERKKAEKAAARAARDAAVNPLGDGASAAAMAAGTTQSAPGLSASRRAPCAAIMILVRYVLWLLVLGGCAAWLYLQLKRAGVVNTDNIF